MRIKHNDTAPDTANADVNFVMTYAEQRMVLRTRRELFRQVINDYAAREDWHGVRDAAAELGEIDAALKVLS